MAEYMEATLQEIMGKQPEIKVRLVCATCGGSGCVECALVGSRGIWMPLEDFAGLMNLAQQATVDSAPSGTTVPERGGEHEGD